MSCLLSKVVRLRPLISIRDHVTKIGLVSLDIVCRFAYNLGTAPSRSLIPASHLNQSMRFHTRAFLGKLVEDTCSKAQIERPFVLSMQK
jgi:hypothetical protein